MMRPARAVLVGVAVLALFSGVVAALIGLLPGPHSPSDYLVMGGAATLACLLALFALWALAGARRAGVFFKRRKR